MFVIDGNIGAGKSTLMKLLSEKFVCFEEPVHEWTLLEDFYKNQDYAFPFQYQVLLSQHSMYKQLKKLTHEVVFMERCAWTSYNVFLSMMKMKDAEIEVYQALYNKLDVDMPIMFFLRLDVNTCIERIRQRGRYEERNIDTDYLSRLDAQYTEALRKFPGKVVYLDALGTPQQLLEEILKELKMFQK